jgi:hypothetical protein
MSQAKKLRSWTVSLHGQVTARLQLPPQFGGNVDLAVEAARTADHTGDWIAAGDPAIALPVVDETALENVSIVSCRPSGSHSWDVVLEGSVKVRATVSVDALVAHEAKDFAELEDTPTRWTVFGQLGIPGTEVEILTPEVVESIRASNVHET